MDLKNVSPYFVSVDLKEGGDGLSLAKPVFKGGCYYNPDTFKTWRQPGFSTLMKWKLMAKAPPSEYSRQPNEEEANKHLKSYIPSFLADTTSQPDNFAVTWLGHATSVVEIDSISVITDPVFSQYTAPTLIQKVGASSSFGNYLASGFSRFVKPPCNVHALPNSLRFVLISHNHHDHLDEQSCRDLANNFGSRLIWCIPEGLRSTMESILPEFCRKSIYEFNWWEGRTFDFSNGRTFHVVATPSQHWSFRSMTDRNTSLWCSWAFISQSPSPKRLFYAGDTGYNDVIFKQIGSVLGPFDLACLPIGAFQPREIMQPQHVSPEESVQIHRDVKSKLSVAVHWGTFAMADEGFMEPEVHLMREIKFQGQNCQELKNCAEKGLSLTDALKQASLEIPFTTVYHGQTYQVC